MIRDTLCIVRSVGEITESNCRVLLIENGFIPEQILIINEKPFAKSIYVSFKKAIDLGYKYLLIIDADVLLRKDSIHELFYHLDDNVFVVQGMILDFITYEIRSAGNHLYNVKHLPAALKLLDINTYLVRPECNLILQMSQLGFKYIVTPTLIGIHDYFQSSYDIYRKCYLHGIKHKSKLFDILEIAKIRDDTYKETIIKGTVSGFFREFTVKVDYRENYMMMDLFNECKKKSESVQQKNFRHIEKCITIYNKNINNLRKYQYIFNIKQKNLFYTLYYQIKELSKIKLSVFIILILYRFNYRLNNYINKH